MSIAEEFFTQVRNAAEGTAVLVTRTDDGFDVKTNFVDAQWRTFLHERGVRKVFTHHVAVQQDARTFTITDDLYEVNWTMGIGLEGGIPVPEFSKSVERSLGTMRYFSMRKTWAADESGDYEKVVDGRFHSEDGRRLIRETADELGLDEKMGTITKVGLVAAIVGVAIAVSIVPIVLLLR